MISDNVSQCVVGSFSISQDSIIMAKGITIQMRKNTRYCTYHFFDFAWVQQAIALYVKEEAGKQQILCSSSMGGESMQQIYLSRKVMLGENS